MDLERNFMPEVPSIFSFFVVRSFFLMASHCALERPSGMYSMVVNRAVADTSVLLKLAAARLSALCVTKADPMVARSATVRVRNTTMVSGEMACWFLMMWHYRMVARNGGLGPSLDLKKTWDGFPLMKLLNILRKKGD